MKKQNLGPDEIELALAAHIFVDGFTLVEHHLNALLEKIRVALKKPSLTMRHMRRSIADWLINGYAVIKDNCLKVTRAGRKHIASLAEVATAPAPLMA